MKYIDIETLDNGEVLPVLELTESNIRMLLEKLDMPGSLKTMIDPDHRIAARAVTDDAHYKNRLPGVVMSKDGLIR